MANGLRRVPTGLRRVPDGLRRGARPRATNVSSAEVSGGLAGGIGERVVEEVCERYRPDDVVALGVIDAEAQDIR